MLKMVLKSYAPKTTISVLLTFAPKMTLILGPRRRKDLGLEIVLFFIEIYISYLFYIFSLSFFFYYHQDVFPTTFPNEQRVALWGGS